MPIETDHAMPASSAARSPEQARLDTARQFAIQSARLAANTNCQNVVVLDVSAVSPVTDFMVIATGTSPRQMQTVCDEVEEAGGEQDFKSFSRVGDDSSSWTCIDFVHVVLHVFSQDARSYYDLDGLWGDARPVEWRDAIVPSATGAGDPVRN
jgi:ribosome-associated protein